MKSEMELLQLNAWIAEHVFGWTFIDRRTAGWGLGPDVWSTGNAENPTHQGFNPTTDPAAAMEVLKKVAEGDSGITLGFYMSENLWVAKNRKGYASAQTLELAICKLARQLFTEERGSR